MKRNVVPRGELTAEMVRAILKYDPETGEFAWLGSSAPGRSSRRVVGTLGEARPGYVRLTICVYYKKYRAHNIAWLIMTGGWPPEGWTIDHINKDPSDNRWANLRLATASQNQANRSKQVDNTSGFKGVSWVPTRKKYQVGIGYRGKRIALGWFDTAEEAHAAYCAAAKEYHGEFARLE